MFNPNFLERTEKNVSLDQLTENSSLNIFLLIFAKNEIENAVYVLIFLMHHSFRLPFSFFETVIDMHAKISHLPLKLYGEGELFLYIILHI